MNFQPERLLQLRTSLNINKAEAARRLNISAMAYGRYEKGAFLSDRMLYRPDL